MEMNVLTIGKLAVVFFLFAVMIGALALELFGANSLSGRYLPTAWWAGFSGLIVTLLHKLIIGDAF